MFKFREPNATTYFAFALSLLVVCSLLRAVPSLAALAAVLALVFVVAGFQKITRKGKYDLEKLREVHEREELRSLVVEEIQEGDNVLGPHCKELYASKYPVCPSCGNPPNCR